MEGGLALHDPHQAKYLLEPNCRYRGADHAPWNRLGKVSWEARAVLLALSLGLVQMQQTVMEFWAGAGF